MFKIEYKNKVINLEKRTNAYLNYSNNYARLTKTIMMGFLHWNNIDYSPYIYDEKESYREIPINATRVIKESIDRFIKKYDLKHNITEDLISNLYYLLSKEVASSIEKQFPQFLKTSCFAKIPGKWHMRWISTKDLTHEMLNKKNILKQKDCINTINLDQYYIIGKANINSIVNILENSAAGQLLICENKLQKLEPNNSSNTHQEVSRDNFLQILNLYIYQIPTLCQGNFKKYRHYNLDICHTLKCSLNSYDMTIELLNSFNAHNPNRQEDFKKVLQEATKEALYNMLNTSNKNNKAENNAIAENVSSWLDLVSLGRIRRTCRKAADGNSCMSR